MPKIRYLHKTREGISSIYPKKSGDILQNMNFSRYYRNRGKFIYGFDPNIILFEKSTYEFHKFPDIYIHHSNQKTDTGLKLELLQDYTFIALDIFKKTLQNKGINNKLEAWLTFLCVDEPETIMKLIEAFPEFKPLYDDVYQICRNTEKVMEMFSKELQELDRNTVQYMIDEMQDTIDSQKKTIDTQQDTIDSQKV